jgi:hypothetical protein
MLERQGEDYEPQVLDEEAYAEIMDAATSFGGSRGRGGVAGGRGGRGR